MRAAFSLLILVLAVAAAPSAAQPLTVYDALAHVETAHPTLGQLRAALAINRGERRLGYGLDAPTVSYAREGIGDGTFSEQRFVVGQTVASPVASYYGRQRLDAEAEALRLNLDAQRSLLKASVEKAFVEAMYAERLIALRMEALALARQLAAAAAEREASGEASGLETMRAEIGLYEAEAALAEAEQRQAQAQVAIAAAVALEPDVAVVTPGPLAYRAVAVTRAEATDGLAALPEAQRAQARLDAARLGVRAARTAWVPDLVAEVFPQDFGRGFDRIGFQVGLRIPLPGTPAYRGARGIAEGRLRERTWMQEAATQQLAAEAEAAWRGFAAARAAVLRYRTDVGPQTDTLVARTHEGYRLGEVPLFALLDAQRAALAAEERYAAALRDYTWRLIDLERFTGRRLAFPNASTQLTNR